MKHEANYYITDFCLIRNKKIFRNGELLFSGTEDKPLSFFTEAYKHFGFSYSKFYKMDTLCRLGFLSSELLMLGNDRNFKAEDFGIILYNAASSVDTDRNHQQSISDRNAYFPSPSVFVYTLPNIVIGEICIRHKLYGESAFFISEKFDPEALYEYVKTLLDCEVIQSCFTGWMECDADRYDCALFRVEKQVTGTEGIAIFEAKSVEEIYSQ